MAEPFRRRVRMRHQETADGPVNLSFCDIQKGRQVHPVLFTDRIALGHAYVAGQTFDKLLALIEIEQLA